MSQDQLSESVIVGQIVESYVARHRMGESVSIEEFVQRYPALADELREVIPAGTADSV